MQAQPQKPLASSAQMASQGKRKGLEPSAEKPCFPAFSPVGGAKSNAADARNSTTVSQIGPDLATVVEVWPALPEVPQYSTPSVNRKGIEITSLDGCERRRYYIVRWRYVNRNDMRDLMTVIKALADESRVRILWAVQGRELCVCQIVELLGLAQSTVSKHVSILHQARLVDSRKEGRWMFYRAAGADSPVEAREIAAAVSKLLADNPQAAEDTERLKQIMKIDRDELCRRQSRC
jgi:ArsR family transcriptional regulator, arsenate/arsenite/antimonite-responsive transcriptional repressor